MRRIYLFPYSRCPVDSIRDAVLTVSPNKQYLGILIPTTPAAQEPGHTYVCSRFSIIYKGLRDQRMKGENSIEQMF